MKKESFTYRSRLEAPAEEVYKWHTRPGAFERLKPPWERVSIEGRTGSVEEGARVRLSIGRPGLKWLLEHRDIVPGRQFCDYAIKSPFPYWKHSHRFIPESQDASVLEDHLEYGLPLGGLGRLAAGGFMRKKLERLFRYRHRITACDLAALKRGAIEKPLKILVSGSSGLIGSALIPFLTCGGHRVMRLVRRKIHPGEETVFWDPLSGRVDSNELEGFDAVIHLAGESVAPGRWTESKKERIRLSRIKGTQVLIDSLSRCDRPPKVLICASATGYYGNRGDELLDENSGPGNSFLSQVCLEWEQTAAALARTGVRVTSLRFGMVLSPEGGALGVMLLPFRLGAGGPLGDGRQWMSWISIHDAVRAIYHILLDSSLAGPVNLVSPGPVTNREFTCALARTLNRPAFFRTPAFMLKVALGPMAEELLLASCRVKCAKLEQTHFAFCHPELKGALEFLLGKQ